MNTLQIKRLLSIVVILTVMWGIELQAQAQAERPRNVILKIGDGMGLSQLSSTYFYMDEEPAFSRFKYIGLCKTSAENSVVTQSGRQVWISSGFGPDAGHAGGTKRFS